MAAHSYRFRRYLRQLIGNLSAGHSLKDAFDEPLLRSELFSADQMEQRGKQLATLHEIAHQRPRDYLMKRLAANEAVLAKVCAQLTTAVKAGQQIMPAGEWLLDNFYLIEEQIHTARRHMPKGYSRELPRLSGGPSAGLPRVYDIALEIISHGDGRVDATSLCRFVAAYQTVSTLKLGELWAIPIMLRLALIENLRRVAIRIAAKSLPDATRYLKPRITFEQLDAAASRMSDNEAAAALNKARQALFQSIADALKQSA